MAGAAGAGLAALEGVALGALGVGLSLCLSVEDVLLCGAEGGLDFLDGGVDGCDVLCFVGVFEFGYGCLDGCFLVGGYLVAEFAELFLGLEDDGVGLVEFVDAFFFFCVGCCVGCGFVFHAFDFCVGEAAGGFDADALLFAGGFIFS